MIKHSLASLGEKLKLVREEAGLSLEELSEKTKIQIKYLQRLENEEYDKLPPAVYLRGFIQKWAQMCHSGPEELLLQFYRENKFFNPASRDVKIQTLAPRSFIITLKHFIFVLLGALGIIVGVYFYYNQALVLNMPQVEILSPREFNSVSHDGSITIRGESQGVNILYINDTAITPGSDGIFEYPYPLQDGLNTVVISARGGGKSEEIEIVRKILKL